MSVPLSPSGEPDTSPARAPRLLIGLTATLLVLRLCLGGVVHLTEDEAYYRLWAQAPAFGYYDHPPMIAWWIWIGVRLVGDTSLGVRLLPILSSAAIGLLVFDLARLVGAAQRDAERAGVWYNAMPLVAAGGMLAVPDAPAAFFWTLSLWASLRALRRDRLAWWFLAGGAAGLATLSKYSALFLGPGVLLWLVATPDGRRRLAMPGPWVALGLAGGLFGVNVLWNADHQWLTMIKQFGRVAPQRLAPGYLLEFISIETFLINPLLAIFLILSLPPRNRAGPLWARVGPFVFVVLPFVVYLLLHSLHDRIEAHWPAPAYPAIAICAALAASDATGLWLKLRSAVPILGLGSCAVLGLYVAWPLLGGSLSFDPALPIRGWPSFAARIDGLAREKQAGWVGVTSYGLASQLDDEAALRSPVIQLSERARWQGLRTGSAVDMSRPGLLVELPRRINLGELRRCFMTAQPLGFIQRGPVEGRAEHYEVLLLSGPKRDVIVRGCGEDKVRED